MWSDGKPLSAWRVHWYLNTIAVFSVAVAMMEPPAHPLFVPVDEVLTAEAELPSCTCDQEFRVQPCIKILGGSPLYYFKKRINQVPSLLQGHGKEARSSCMPGCRCLEVLACTSSMIAMGSLAQYRDWA
jgi:hypothetical protein